MACKKEPLAPSIWNSELSLALSLLITQRLHSGLLVCFVYIKIDADARARRLCATIFFALIGIKYIVLSYELTLKPRRFFTMKHFATPPTSKPMIHSAIALAVLETLFVILYFISTILAGRAKRIEVWCFIPLAYISCIALCANNFRELAYYPPPLYFP